MQSMDSEPVIFSGVTRGTVVEERGENNFGWDSIFLPDGYSETYSQMSSEAKSKISHRSKSLLNFRNYLEQSSLS
jgi:inosine triphosphate pyrophosphatase